MLEACENENLWFRRDEYGRIWMLIEMFMESSIPLSILVIVSVEKGLERQHLSRRLCWMQRPLGKTLKQYIWT